jgi:hypothetical protein
MPLPERNLPWNPSGGEMWMEKATCPNCASNLVVRKVILYGYRMKEEGERPICDTEVASVHGFSVEVGLVKDVETIIRLQAFRERNA